MPGPAIPIVSSGLIRLLEAALAGTSTELDGHKKSMASQQPQPHTTNRQRMTLSEIRPVPRRGLSRVEAAMYVGVSPVKFDELVRDGRMPPPKRIDGRKLWDVRELDMAFDTLPSENQGSQGTTWDDFRADHD